MSIRRWILGGAAICAVMVISSPACADQPKQDLLDICQQAEEIMSARRPQLKDGQSGLAGSLSQFTFDIQTAASGLLPVETVFWHQVLVPLAEDGYVPGVLAAVEALDCPPDVVTVHVRHSPNLWLQEEIQELMKGKSLAVIWENGLAFGGRLRSLPRHDVTLAIEFVPKARATTASVFVKRQVKERTSGKQKTLYMFQSLELKRSGSEKPFLWKVTDTAHYLQPGDENRDADQSGRSLKSD